jgi:hypothetical protein
VPNVQWKTPDDGQKNCPKHVEFLDKNKSGKIGASVGFIKKKFVTMHCRPHERKIKHLFLQLCQLPRVSSSPLSCKYSLQPSSLLPNTPEITTSRSITHVITAICIAPPFQHFSTLSTKNFLILSGSRARRSLKKFVGAIAQNYVNS